MVCLKTSKLCEHEKKTLGQLLAERSGRKTIRSWNTMALRHAGTTDIVQNIEQRSLDYGKNVKIGAQGEQ